MSRSKRFFVAAAIGAAALLVAPRSAQAHCDGLDGPVVKAAQTALVSGQVSSVLIWVQPQYEPEVRSAFEQARQVRRAGGAAQELADRYFFETVVRLHRAGEGEPYTGLKPAGRDLGPAIPAADAALESGSADALTSLVNSRVQQEIAERFARVRDAKRRAASGDVAAGREYVAAYVDFVQHVERVYETAAAKSSAHETEK